MNKPIIVIKLKPKHFSKLVALAESVYAGLDMNPDFPNPQPTLADLSLSIAEVKNAMAGWGEKGNRGSHVNYVNLMTKAIHLHSILTQLGEWCMSSMNSALPYPEQRVLLESTGFELKRAKTPQGVLEAVQNFRRFIARNIPEGQVKLAWRQPLNVTTPTNVKGYVVYRSKTEVFSTAIVIAVSSKASYIDSPGPGKWFYWVTPFNNKGEGVISEIVTVRIAEE